MSAADAMTAAGDSAGSPSGAPWWKRFLRFWLAIEPMRHAWWETLSIRCIIAWAAWLTLRQPSPFDQQPQPHGLAVWGVDFTWLGKEALSPYLVPLWAVCLLLYVANVFPVLTLFPVLVASIGLGVLGNSQGAIGHTTQVLTVVLLAQWMAYVWAAIQPRTRLSMPHGFTSQQLAADWGRQSLAATYVVSAITKLIESRGDWISDTPYFGLQVVKSEGMGYYDWLQPRLADSSAWLGQAMVDHPMITAVMLAGALPLELLVFLGLHNRRIALFFGVSLYFFHSTVTEVMQLGFLYHKLLLLALFVNPVFWVVRVVSGGRVGSR
ncbi:hypothetical protein DES53_11468 [Roseimicrobium gellanilyticum]|uniref:Vitamin K-dependent gamma-carboxylase-like protein n=1 Tax=Roseimicrobium gellanilyticum TaxID=748857 RepID=A0A366H7P9_9BACT|nr:hypothetical protein [Roseimicrobium gellanilyticum]RBP37330.1 hypothetical protein DES53_11468 [Roseimicrobium gellanilyticum]